MMKKYAVIILSAGNSSRLGQPKQLLQYKGKTLLENIASEALKIPSANTIIVTGAQKSELEKVVANMGIYFCDNNNWQFGMSSSIKRGLEKALEINKETEAVLLCVSDQPFVDGDLLQNLISTFEETKKITASFYNETPGTPAVFPKQFFSELSDLDGKEGAKKILKAHQNDLSLIPFEKGAIDIDTIEDYKKLADL
ncbi:NTP transferase domain-containing protein [Epilithonimonas sp. UC225_85]|uniref:nucleotidyltransferase family protein n=1 Tax=Epilithonimonas sp. UC225_85 TaxID=3350167 RepID=UPI0036D22577